MYSGRKYAELSGDEIAEETIMRIALGGRAETTREVGLSA
jgi:hypothetical protein